MLNLKLIPQDQKQAINFQIGHLKNSLIDWKLRSKRTRDKLELDICRSQIKSIEKLIKQLRRQR